VHVLFLGSIKILRNAITRVNENSETKMQLFLSGPPAEITNNVSQAMKLLTDTKNSVIELITSTNDTFVGLYLNFIFTDCNRQLEVVERVFGDKLSSLLPLGHFMNCDRYFVNRDFMQYLKRLDFITCNLEEGANVPPEDQAALYVSTCDKYRKVAQSLNLTAKIMCCIEYASKGGAYNGRIGLSLDFYRFWRQLTNLIKVNNTHAPLIMKGVVDVQNFRRFPQPKRATDYYHTGWWRKTHTTSMKKGAFVEKIDEIPVGRISGKCSKICQACKNNNDCCFGTCLSNSKLNFSSAVKNEATCRKEETICPSPTDSISMNHDALIFNSQIVMINN